MLQPNDHSPASAKALMQREDEPGGYSTYLNINLSTANLDTSLISFKKTSSFSRCLEITHPVKRKCLGTRSLVSPRSMIRVEGYCPGVKKFITFFLKIQFLQMMSYMRPRILPKKNMYHLWVKKNLGGAFGGSEC